MVTNGSMRFIDVDLFTVTPMQLLVGAVTPLVVIDTYTIERVGSYSTLID